MFHRLLGRIQSSRKGTSDFYLSLQRVALPLCGDHGTFRPGSFVCLVILKIIDLVFDT